MQCRMEGEAEGSLLPLFGALRGAGGYVKIKIEINLKILYNRY